MPTTISLLWVGGFALLSIGLGAVDSGVSNHNGNRAAVGVILSLLGYSGILYTLLHAS